MAFKYGIVFLVKSEMLLLNFGNGNNVAFFCTMCSGSELALLMKPKESDICFCQQLNYLCQRALFVLGREVTCADRIKLFIHSGIVESAASVCHRVPSSSNFFPVSRYWQQFSQKRPTKWKKLVSENENSLCPKVSWLFCRKNSLTNRATFNSSWNVVVHDSRNWQWFIPWEGNGRFTKHRSCSSEVSDQNFSSHSARVSHASYLGYLAVWPTGRPFSKRNENV